MKSFFILTIFISTFFACSSEDVILQEAEIIADTPIVNNSKPNILLIIADDIGVDATPGYDMGSIKPNMPQLQNLQASGITFNNVWSNPTCAPTRATILTGKYGFRTGVTKASDVLSTSETSIQSYLKNEGAQEYANAVIGKWHLSRNDNHPNIMGIDYFAGFTGAGTATYWDWDLNINGVSNPSTEYTTTKFTDLAIDWIDEQEAPWFLWLAYNAPHSPFHLPPTNLHSQGNLPTDQASISANPTPYYMAMIEAMDTEMGRLFDSMSTEEMNNTVIIFIGDNGTPGQVIQGSSFTKAKGSVYQGGINVPMIISGKGVNRFGATENTLINSTDLFATISNIAEISKEQINDSHSFYNTFSDTASEGRSFVYSEIRQDSGNHDVTIRNSNFKYFLFEDGSEALYKLITGEIESTNLLNATLNNEQTAEKEALITTLTELKQ